VAIGGNFLYAKVKVWTPGGKGVGVRRPIVDKVSGASRLDIVKRKKIGRLIMLGRRAIGAPVNSYFQTDVIGVGKSSVKESSFLKEGEKVNAEKNGDGGAEIEAGSSEGTEGTENLEDLENAGLVDKDIQNNDEFRGEMAPNVESTSSKELVGESVAASN